MTITTSKKLMGRLALSLSLAASLVGMHTAADAAFVVVNVDPAFGPARPDLGWSAIGVLFVPNSCVLNSSTVYDCAGAQIQDVKVKFYNTGDLSKTTVETLNFDPYPMMSTSSSFQRLLTIGFDSNGKVNAFTTNFSNDYTAASPLARGPIVPPSVTPPESKYALKFSLSPSIYSAKLKLTDSVLDGSEFSTATGGVGGSTITVKYYTDVQYQALISNVPEPSTLAMALSGLAAFAGRRFLTRRRRA